MKIILSLQQNSFQWKNGPSFPCHAYSDLTVLPKHLSRESATWQIGAANYHRYQRAALLWKMIPQKSIVRFHILFFLVFFFPPGNPLQTGKSYVCSHSTSTPDVGSQGQPVRQGYCFLSTAIRPSRTANQTLHTSCNHRAGQAWLKEDFITTRLLQVVQGSALGQRP